MKKSESVETPPTVKKKRDLTPAERQLKAKMKALNAVNNALVELGPEEKAAVIAMLQADLGATTQP